MPVAHLILHAYGTWMPDRPAGSVHWRRGYTPPAPGLAEAYRRNQRQISAHFDDNCQRLLLDEWMTASRHQVLEPIAAATDPTHCHVLVGWRGERTAMSVRAQLKQSLTRRLNRDAQQRKWFTQGGDTTFLRIFAHLEHLREVYLPDHVGWKWDRAVGFWLTDRSQAVAALP